MTDLTLHDDIDRLDSGITRDPDVSGIITAARRRRRLTRAILTAGGLATAAVVAPLALLVGGGTTTVPSSPGFAAEPTAAPNEALTDEQYEAKYAADMTAAVTEAVPDAVLEMPIDSWGFGWVWGQTYTVANGAHVGINSSFDRTMSGEGRRACGSEPDKVEIVTRCTETVVGDRVVRVAEGRFPGKDRILWRHVDVRPADGATGPTVWVDASVHGAAASTDQLPSVEALTDIALDERVAPTRERGVIHMAPESQWGNRR